MTEQKKVDAKKKAGIELIFEFKDSINNLMHWYGMYLNLMTQLTSKFEHNDITDTLDALKSMDSSEKNQIVQYCQEIRYAATICMIKYKSIYPSLKLKSVEEIENRYENIKKDFIIFPEDSFNLIIELNKVMTTDIISEILESNADVIGEIFPDGTAKTTDSPSS